MALRSMVSAGRGISKSDRRASKSTAFVWARMESPYKDDTLDQSEAPWPSVGRACRKDRARFYKQPIASLAAYRPFVL